eukprot:CAMPEP_0196583218 /NCGR_PEP_ID=MMETSP1081-20130531/42536_1 /TAXON_ID=36882 /ORGANISM="Pyramimonas amylifera, Strain CCMP720" /LENGTH=294 /DNA_ID=CAMNT_0041904033 /DNA_START=156 /DNA_END=1040 /DNA_ORIENTATION=-
MSQADVGAASRCTCSKPTIQSLIYKSKVLVVKQQKRRLQDSTGVNSLVSFTFPKRGLTLACSSSSTQTQNVKDNTEDLFESKAASYNKEMKSRMFNPYEYHPDLGLYYHEVYPGLIVGTQPKTAADIEFLQKNENVSTIFNMQQDENMQEWGVDKNNLVTATKELGMRFVHCPAVDFDQHSLRHTLPWGAALLNEAIESGGKVYVHCTAGLGRSPAMVIAYLFWFEGMQLDEAYQHLVSQRPCGPKRESIRGATYDMLNGNSDHDFNELPGHMFATLSEEERSILQYRVLSMLS